MKRTLKIWSLVVVALLLTVGCIFAIAETVTNPDIVVADGATQEVNGESFTNVFGKDVTFTWNKDANKYVLGVVGITTNNIETTYNAKEQSAITLYNAGDYDALTYTINPNGVNPGEFGLACRVNFDASGVKQKNAGDYKNEIVFFLMKGTDDYTKWFHIDYTYGDFKINQYALTIQTGSLSKVYDGTALNYKQWEYVEHADTGVINKVFEGDLLFETNSESFADITYIYSTNKKVGDVTVGDVTYPWCGQEENEMEAEWNPNYAITKKWGTLTLYPVTGLQYTMSGASLTKEYDGTPLKYNGSVTVAGVNESLLKSGDTFTTPTPADLSAQDIWPVNVGSVKVADLGIAIKFTNAAGEAIECYAYELLGDLTLTITPRKITIDITAFEVIYGAAIPTYGYTVPETITVPNPEYTEGSNLSETIEVANGTLVENVNNGGLKDALDIAFACSYAVGSPVNADGYAITASVAAETTESLKNGNNANYEITINQTGKVVVGKKAITFTALDVVLQYGDKVPENYGFSITAGALVKDDVPNLEFTTTYTELAPIGTDAYDIIVTLGESAVHNNYDITLVNAKITVTERKLTIQLPNKESVYGGYQLTPAELVAGWTVGEGQYLGTGLPNLNITNIVCDYDKDNDASNNAGTYVIDGDWAAADEEAAELLKNYEIEVLEGELTVIGMMLEEIVWLPDVNNNIHVYNGAAYAPLALGRIPGTNEWILIDTTAKTTVGKYVAYALGTKATDAAEIAGCTISSDKASNYRINKLTAGEGFFEIVEVVDAKFNSASVVIGGAYALNFKIDARAIDQYESFKLVLKRDGVKDVVITDLADLTYDANAGVYIITYTNIGPQSMDKAVTVTLTTTRGDGLAGQTDARTYSIADYCYNMLEDNATDKALVNVIVAMLRYGKTAGANVTVDAKYDSVVTKRDKYVSIQKDDIVAGATVGIANIYSLNNSIVAKIGLTLPATNADIKAYKVEVWQDGVLVQTIVQNLDNTVFIAQGGRYVASYNESFVSAVKNTEFKVIEIATGKVVGGRLYNVESYVDFKADDPNAPIYEAMIDFCYALKEYTK